MLERKGRQVGVARQVTGHSRVGEQAAQDALMALRGSHQARGRKRDPLVDVGERALEIERTHQHVGSGHQPQEGEQRQPGETDRLAWEGTPQASVRAQSRSVASTAGSRSTPLG